MAAMKSIHLLTSLTSIAILSEINGVRHPLTELEGWSGATAMTIFAAKFINSVHFSLLLCKYIMATTKAQHIYSLTSSVYYTILNETDMVRAPTHLK